MSFSGKVALITGAGSGIGADVARHLANLGAQVSIVDLNGKGLDETAEKINKCGGQMPLKIVADVTKDSERIVDDTIKYFGQLDILINSAGIAVHDDIYSIDLQECNEAFNVNVLSIVILTKLCVPYLEKTKGNIINISSVAGLKKGIRGILSYAMSKAALDQFTTCCALDLAPKRIRVNAINPSIIRTPLLSYAGVEKSIDYCKEVYPIARIGEVSDTSAAIAFLANDQTASFLTGILLPVDGGLMATGRSKCLPLD